MFTIKNFKIEENINNKFLVVNIKTGLPAPVTRADKSSPEGELRGTYQNYTVDEDVIIQSRLENGEPFITVYKFDKQNLKATEVNIGRILGNLSMEAIKWLYEFDDNPFLPANVGWDGVYSQSDLFKRATILQALPTGLDENFIERLTKAGYFTPLKEVQKKPVYTTHVQKPILAIDKEVWSHAIIVYDEIAIIREIIDSQTIKTGENINEIILFKFNPLKVKGNEQFVWERNIFLTGEEI